MKCWKKVNDTTWEVGIPNKFFGGFNPYAETLHGDWFERGKWCHTGEIYLNDIAPVLFLYLFPGGVYRAAVDRVVDSLLSGFVFPSPIDIPTYVES